MEDGNKRTKALVLMSGGLDSMLAAKILEEQGILTTLVCFRSHFFSCGAAEKAAAQIGLELRVEDISAAHLDIVKNPRHGRGAGFNPCIDCHLLMLVSAKRIMEAEGYDFVATGEVLGERPMSQNRLSLDIIEKEAGLKGFLLRPLSAKLMEPTIAENNGLVDRNKLYDISGRGRSAQYQLAKHFDIKDIPQPGGGCILTEPEYGHRLKALSSVNPDFDSFDTNLLRYCRPVWHDKILFAIARDKKDCENMLVFAKTGDIILRPENFPGPIVTIRDFGGGAVFDEVTGVGKNYLLEYSKKAPLEPNISVENVQR